MFHGYSSVTSDVVRVQNDHVEWVATVTNNIWNECADLLDEEAASVRGGLLGNVGEMGVN